MADQYLTVKVKAIDFDDATMEPVEGLEARLSRAGKARMASLTPEQRRALASKAAKARWRKSRKPCRARPIDVIDGEQRRPFPSVTAAAKWMQVSRSTVYNRLAAAEQSQQEAAE